MPRGRKGGSAVRREPFSRHPLTLELPEKTVLDALTFGRNRGPVDPRPWESGRPVRLEDDRVWVWNNRAGVLYADRLPAIIAGEVQTYCICHGHTKFLYINRNPLKPDDAAVQSFRDAALELMAEAAVRMGGPSKLAVDYGYALVPQDLEREGFADITWVKGRPDQIRGDGQQVIHAAREGDEFLLTSGSRFCPWNTLRQIDIPAGKRSAAGIYELAKTSLTF